MAVKYQPTSKYLCSVYPGQLPALARNYGPNPTAGTARRTVYKFKPVDRSAQRVKDRYDVIEIVDSWENVPNPSKPVQTVRGRMPFDASPVPCEEIVKCLLKDWCWSIMGLPSGVSPGIMEIANSTPTEAELNELYRRHAEFAAYMLQEGDRLYAEKKMKEITSAMRESAKWLGQERAWADPGMAAQNTNCPACRQLIHREQIKCHHCGTQVKAMPPELAAINAGVTPKVEPVTPAA